MNFHDLHHYHRPIIPSSALRRPSAQGRAGDGTGAAITPVGRWGPVLGPQARARPRNLRHRQTRPRDPSKRDC